MNRGFTRLVVLVLALAAVGCTSMPTGYTGKDVGYIVAGLGAAKSARYHIYSIFIEDGTEVVDPYMSAHALTYNIRYGPKADYEDEYEEGAVYILPVKPGKYHIENVFFSMGNATWTPKKLISIPFTVESGRVTYLGNFKGKRTTEPSLFAFTPEFALSDRRITDLAIAKKKKPDLDMSKVNFAIPKRIMLPTYIVQDYSEKDGPPKDIELTPVNLQYEPKKAK